MLRTCTECGEPATEFRMYGIVQCLCPACHKTRQARVEKQVKQLLELDREVFRGSVHVVEDQAESSRPAWLSLL